MQPRFDLRHHLLRGPHAHHHHHIPVFLLCPCSCHHRHRHQLPWPSPLFPPPPPLSDPRPPAVPCAEVLPDQSSSQPLSEHRSPWLGGDHSQEAAAELKDGDFSAAGLEDQEWNESQVNDGDGDDDEDVVFVLTDEWRELFAKSEAKRKLAKQQKKKNGK